MSEPGCLFCRIIGGEIPADLIHQDDRCIVISDINPQAPTHVLVIPREHLESGHLLRTAARVANENGLSESGYRTVIYTGAGAGQSVFHLHVHVLGGRPMNWPPG